MGENIDMSDMASGLTKILANTVISLTSEGEAILKIMHTPVPNRYEALEILHKFKGASGTAGFNELFQACKIIHDRVKADSNDTVSIDDSMVTQLTEFERLLSQLDINQSSLISRLGH